MKTYVIAGVIIAILVFSGGAYFAGYKAGGTACDKKVQDATLEFRDREDKANLELAESQKEREVIYRDKIKIVREASAQCLGTDAPDSVIRLFND